MLEKERIRKGDVLIEALTSDNQDAQQRIDPAEIAVDRQASRHIACGRGIHYCLGAPLARLEGDTAFTTLLRRMPAIHLDILW